MFEIKKYFNSVDPKSKANQFRRKRFDLFLQVFDYIISNKDKVDILDVGGWEIFWKNMGIENYPNVYILYLNFGKKRIKLTKASTTYFKYLAALNKQAENAANRSSERERLTNLFNDADSVLYEELDPMMELFIDSNPDFYNAYQSARIIKNLGTGSGSNNESDEE